MTAVLEAKGLQKRFGDIAAVRGVDLSIGEGETYGLLGPNGAGKTTAISMIAGILRRDAGTVAVDGRPVSSTTTAARAAIGLVPQEVAVYPDLTGVENLRFFGRLYGMGGHELAARIDTVLGVIGLHDRAGDKAGEFSGGMQRRLNTVG